MTVKKLTIIENGRLVPTDLSMDADLIEISKVEGNKLEVKEDGLYYKERIVVDGDDALNVVSGKLNVVVSPVGDNILQKTAEGLYVGPEPVSTTVDQAVHSAVSSSAVYNALTSNTIAFANEKANVKIENPASSPVQINTSVNGISAVLKNIVKLESVRETVSHSTGTGTRYLSLTNFNIFVIDCSGSSGTVLLNGLNDLDGNQAKTITIIVKNTTALTWPVEFAWVDNAPPTLQPSTTLVVTGIYASNASSATYTGGKVLCTFSYYTI